MGGSYGTRIWQETNGNRVTYLNDINMSLPQVIAEHSQSAEGNLKHSYHLYGMNRIGQEVGDEWAYFGYDGLGSVRQMTDINGNLRLSADFDPYGNIREGVGLGNSSFAYTGEQVDPNGLVYLRARYYDPRTGAFLTPDPIDGGGAQWNAYAYVNGNPINNIDPDGCAALAIAGAFAVGMLFDAGIQYLSNCGQVDWGQASISGGISAATAGLSKLAYVGKLGKLGSVMRSGFAGRMAVESGLDFTLSAGYDMAFRNASFGQAFQRNVISSTVGNLVGEGVGNALGAGLRGAGRGFRSVGNGLQSLGRGANNFLKDLDYTSVTTGGIPPNLFTRFAQRYIPGIKLLSIHLENRQQFHSNPNVQFVGGGFFDLRLELEGRRRNLDNYIRQHGIATTRKKGYPDTTTPNSIFYRMDSMKNITNYRVYNQIGNPYKRVDLTGPAHGGVPTPHVIGFIGETIPRGPRAGDIQIKQYRGLPREADFWEIP